MNSVQCRQPIVTIGAKLIRVTIVESHEHVLVSVLPAICAWVAIAQMPPALRRLVRSLLTHSGFGNPANGTPRQRRSQFFYDIDLEGFLYQFRARLFQVFEVRRCHVSIKRSPTLPCFG